ncbi:TM2 domain-containing protein [Mammaliicoccus sciuri]|uniref:TM2 domain-containing protein n=1 Tax=Mammaliicoccus sciuri TaxID=1296 RepID=UPI003CC64A7D
MNLEEKSYIESQVANKGKKTSIAYILLIFIGGLGGHRFYLEKTGSAVGLLLLTLLTGWFTFFIPSLIWIIVDACLIPGYINENNEKIRREATNEIMTIRGK